MVLKRTPNWVLAGLSRRSFAKAGLAIFPVLVVLGAVFFLISGGKANFLFWLVIPSIIFEQLFEGCCFAFSNSYAANLIFAFVFWFSIGAVGNWLVCKNL